MNKLSIILILVVGAVTAMSAVNPMVVSESRWDGGINTTAATAGGGITAVNLGGSDSTEKWASYYGVVADTIVRLAIGENDSPFYVWSTGQHSGGIICVSTNPEFDFGSANSVSGITIDNAWRFNSGDVDSGANTYSASGCALNFTGNPIPSTAYASLQSGSTFESCAVGQGNEIRAGDLGSLAFCTNLQNSTIGRSYNGEPSSYEVMVPTSIGEGEAYYFFLELK